MKFNLSGSTVIDFAVYLCTTGGSVSSTLTQVDNTQPVHYYAYWYNLQQSGNRCSNNPWLVDWMYPPLGSNGGSWFSISWLGKSSVAVWE